MGHDDDIVSAKLIKLTIFTLTSWVWEHGKLVLACHA